MPKIRVNFHFGVGRVSRLIELITRSGVSHVSGEFVDDRIVVQSQEGAGVQLFSDPPVFYINCAERVETYELNVSWEAYNAMLVFARAQVGKAYDYPSVLMFPTLVRAFLRHNPEKEQESRASKERWFCSEYWTAILVEGGLRPLERIQPWEVSPGLLYLSPLFPEGQHVRR